METVSCSGSGADGRVLNEGKSGQIFGRGGLGENLRDVTVLV